MDIKSLQLENVSIAIIDMFFDNTIDLNAEPEKAYEPMLVTLSGMTMDSDLLQSENAYVSILEMPFGIVISVIISQLWKAKAPILLTPSGISTAIMFSLFSKAEIMPFTGKPFIESEW